MARKWSNLNLPGVAELFSSLGGDRVHLPDLQLPWVDFGFFTQPLPLLGFNPKSEIRNSKFLSLHRHRSPIELRQTKPVEVFVVAGALVPKNADRYLLAELQ